MASNSTSQPFVKCYYQFPLCFLPPCQDSAPRAAEQGQASSRVTNVTNLLVNTDTNVTEPSAGAALLPEPPGIPRGPAGPCCNILNTGTQWRNWHCSVV